MTNTEAKKALYKENPQAQLVFINKEHIDYRTDLEDGTIIFFRVPLSDIQEASFYPQMPAKLLIRYVHLVTEKK